MQAAIAIVVGVIKAAYDYNSNQQETAKLVEKLKRIQKKYEKMDKRTTEVDMVIFKMGEICGMIKAKNPQAANIATDACLTIAGVWMRKSNHASLKWQFQSHHPTNGIEEAKNLPLIALSSHLRLCLL